LNADEREELIRDFSRMNEAERIEVHRLQTELLRGNRQRLRGVEQPIAAYSMLLLALDKRRRMLEAPAQKIALSSEAAVELSRLRRLAVTGSRKREGEVAKLIRIRWREEIKRLREEGCSWRQVSTYIAKWHKKKVSHTYLSNVFEHLEAQQKDRDELFNQGED
jgi:hypothetical protein